jgi:hypothetical protein
MSLRGPRMAGDPKDHTAARLDNDASKADVKLTKRRDLERGKT